MMTITGKIEDTTGQTLHATIDFRSQSTPLAAAGIITTNTDKTLRSNPSDGTFSLNLAPGNYQVTITANGQSTTFSIAVPVGNGTVDITTLVTTPLALPASAPYTLWNGQRAGSITFLPTPAPPAPTFSEVAFPGGNIDQGDSRYTYFISYVTAIGETVVSGPLAAHVGSGSPAPNMAIRLFLQVNPSGVTGVRIWRTFVDNGHSYDASSFPANVGLLATVNPSAAYYDDWESTAQFAARVDATKPPTSNTTAGQILSSLGNSAYALLFADQGLLAPNQTIYNDGSLLTAGLGDARYKQIVKKTYFRFADGQFQLLDVSADPSTPWRALTVNRGVTGLGSLKPDSDPLDNPFLTPTGTNYFFANGQLLVWDAIAFANDNTKPWRAITMTNGVLGWSAPIANAGLVYEAPTNGSANYRFFDGQFFLWDAAHAATDLSRPWRSVGVAAGVITITQPQSL